MVDEKRYSVQEAANILGVNRRTIYKKLSPEFRARFVTDKGTGLTISSLGIKELSKRKVSPKSSQKATEATAEATIISEDSEVHFLRTLVNNLTEEKKTLNKLLDQEQQLHAQTKNDLSKMLENNQLLIEEKTKLLDLVQQKKWWQFWK